MPRTTITATTPGALLSGTPAANALDVTFTAIDSSNGNQTTHNGQLMLLFYNSHATTSYTYTVTSTADRLGRTGDISDTLAAGEYALVGPIPTEGFQQTTGYIYYTASNASVKVLPIQLSGSLLYR